QLFNRGPAACGQRLQRADDGGADGDVGLWAFLDVDQPDLDRHAVKARDGAARVGVLSFEIAVRIERCGVGPDLAQDAVVVLIARVDRLRNDVAGGAGDARAVSGVLDQAKVQRSLDNAVCDGRSRS